MINEPILVAERVYADYIERVGALPKDLMHAAVHGIAYSGPDVFVLGWPTTRARVLAGRPHAAKRGAADCWFILVAAGRGALRKVGELLPFNLPYIAYHRRKKTLKIWELDRLRRHVNGQ